MKKKKEGKMEEKVLEFLPFWSNLSINQKEKLIQGSRKVSYKAGDLIYSPAKDCLGMLFVQEGVLHTYLMSEDDRRVNIFRLRDGDVSILSMSCIFPTITFDVEIEAETDCQVLLLPTSVLASLRKENIYVENYMYKIITETFSSAIEVMKQFMFLTLEQRVATFLIDESVAQKTLEIKTTQEKLANTIGSAREAVARVLKQLAAKGIIKIHRGCISIEKKCELYHIIQ